MFLLLKAVIDVLKFYNADREPEEKYMTVSKKSSSQKPSITDPSVFQKPADHLEPVSTEYKDLCW
jgi:hypothetical protein